MSASKQAAPYGQGLGPEEHGRRVASMFGRIARVYDLLNRVLSLGLDQRWRKQLVRSAALPQNGLLLDVAAGTMDVTLLALDQEPTSRALALDFAAPMLLRGMQKVPADKAHRVAAALADGRSLPMPDASVDAVTIAFGIRNIVPRGQALTEAHRVLKPGGRLCILEFGSSKSRIMLGLYNFYLGRVLPAIGKLVSGDSGAYTYLAKTIQGFPTAPEFGAELRQAGFAAVSWQRLTFGIVYLHVAEK